MSCTSSPTETQYTTVISSSTSTSFSNSVTTLSGAVTTLVSPSCAASGTISGSNSTGCISSTEITQVSTIAGVVSTAQVPVILTVPVTQTQPTKTLFATSCVSTSQSSSTTSTSSSSSSPPSSPSGTSSLSSALPLSSSETLPSLSPSSSPFSSFSSPATSLSSTQYISTFVPVLTTPPPTTLTTSASTTLADGSVIVTWITITSTLPPAYTYIASIIAVPTQGLQESSEGASSSSSNLAAIIGGTVGGVIGLLAILACIFFIMRRRRTWDDIFERDGDDDIITPHPVLQERGSRIDLNAEPKPYQYGLVGRVTPPRASSPPHSRSPSVGPTETLRSGDSFLGVHSRKSSLTPLLSNSSTQQLGTASSRPSTAGSMSGVSQQYLQAQRPVSRPVSSRVISDSGMSGRTSSPAPLNLAQWSPDMDELIMYNPNELGSSGSTANGSSERRILRVVNPQSPTSTIASEAPRSSLDSPSTSVARKTGFGARSSSQVDVIVHTDGGRVDGHVHTAMSGVPSDPPAYSEN